MCQSNPSSWFVIAISLALALSCRKEDPRCARIADNLAEVALATVREGEPSAEQLSRLRASVNSQKAKIRTQCATALKNDEGGGVSLWMDCMVEARTEEQTAACRSVGTRPKY